MAPTDVLTRVEWLYTVYRSHNISSKRKLVLCESIDLYIDDNKKEVFDDGKVEGYIAKFVNEWRSSDEQDMDKQRSMYKELL